MVSIRFAIRNVAWQTLIIQQTEFSIATLANLVSLAVLIGYAIRNLAFFAISVDIREFILALVAF